MEECAAREAMGETGIEVSNVRFRALTNDVFRNEGKHYVTVWMEGEYLSGEPTVGAAHEMSDVGWFPWDQLPETLILPLRNLLEGHCYPDGGGHASPPIR